MIKILNTLSISFLMLLVMISVVFANGAGSHDGEEGNHDEMMGKTDSTGEHTMHSGSGIGHQFSMILPFTHFAEGHWFAGIMLTLMWLALVYVVYEFIQKKKNSD